MLARRAPSVRAGTGRRHAATTSSSSFGSRVPQPHNEPIKSFMKNSPERVAVEKKLAEFRSTTTEIPIVIGGKEIKTGDIGEVRIPHENKTVIARYHKATPQLAQAAIDASLEAKERWARLDYESRAAVTLKMAELIAGPLRPAVLASTILGQSKNILQAEIDAACETIDFLRFNAQYGQQIAEEFRTDSSTGVWNRLTMRPLEGFVYVISPFNFTAIGVNLNAAPILLGNTCVWKPSDYSLLSSWEMFKAFREAGLPDGVLNFIPGDPVLITKTMLDNPMFAGLHYTGSTPVFRDIWKVHVYPATIGAQMPTYRSYPRIVGETGGKDFLIAHKSSDINALATAMIRGAFEYAGQKCSALSRAYIPESIWGKVKEKLLADMKRVVTGSPEKAATLVNAVIHRGAFERCKSYQALAKSDKTCKILHGGGSDDSVGYFIEPTLVQCENPRHKLMSEEIFGPILSVYVYKDAEFAEVLSLCNSTSEYALTGSIFGKDRLALVQATDALEYASGNFYINDKPTGAVVGQQPFGGARGSGTNDKSGSALNLLRWVQPRTIKETFVPPTDFSYPYMTEK